MLVAAQGFLIRYGMPLVACAVLLGLEPVVRGQTVSNSPRPEMWIPDSAPTCMVESCGKLYMGGSFISIGPRTGSFVAIDPSSAQVNRAMPIFNNTVYAIVSDGAGGWYIGGDFTAVGCTGRSRLAHIRADCTLDPNWNPGANGTVYALAVTGTTVYVGGIFSSTGGQTRNRIAAVDATTGAVRSWNPNASNTVRALAVIGNSVFAGGDFGNIGGQNRLFLAALDANTGAATAWNPVVAGPSTTVTFLAAQGNTVYVAGRFNSISSQSRPGIAAIDATSGAPTSWSPSITNLGIDWIYAFAISATTVYFSGEFQVVGGQTRERVAAVDINTAAVTPWNPNSNNNPNFSLSSIYADGSTVYIGGGFSLVAGQSRRCLAATDSTTGALTAWNPKANYVPYAMGVSAGTVYVGGAFSLVGGITRNYAAAIDLATGEATSWSPFPNQFGIGYTAYTMLISGNTVYVGGLLGASNLWSFDATTGSNHLEWTGSANAAVYALALSGTTLYVGGGFTNVDGQTRFRIAALDATTGALSAWNPFPNSIVRAMAVAGGKVYVGGDFTNIGGQPRNRIAALDPLVNINNATAWDPSGNNNYVLTLAASGNTIYAAGDFTSIGGQTRNRIAALDTAINTNNATAWNPNADNSVYSLFLSGSTVYAGGFFTTIGGQPRLGIAALNNTNGAALPWNPNLAGPNPGVASICASATSLNFGGYFSTVGGENVGTFASFNITNADWTDSAGTWNTAANWTPQIVPNNTSCNQYNVRIAGAKAQVTLDIDATVNTLSMESDATLLITAGDLTIASPEGITNTANIHVGPGHRLIANTATNICGTSQLELAGSSAALSSTGAASTIRLSAPVHGFGVIDAALLNQSNIEADVSGESLAISGSLPASSGGVIRASSGGMLQITRSIGGGGDYVADGGAISIPGASSTTVAGASLESINGGTAQINANANVHVNHVHVGCSAGLRGCIPPVLSCSTGPGGGLHADGDFRIDGDLTLTISSGSDVSVGGNFDNQCTSPTTFDWENGPLILDGAAPQTFELAGADLGPRNSAGFLNNFAMNSLRVEPGRSIEFANNFDNMGNGGCEALYVHTLSLGSGCTITLHNCSIYYDILTRETGVTVLLQGGAVLMNTHAGDFDGDNQVTLADINQFINVLLGAACDSTCQSRADINFDGVVNGVDIPLMIRLLFE